MKNILLPCFLFIGVLLYSCSSDIVEQKETFNSPSNILQQYGNIHNAGLDFIKLDAMASHSNYSIDRMDSVYCKWVVSQYGSSETSDAAKAGYMKAKVVANDIPTISYKRRSSKDASGVKCKLAVEALDECMNNIREKIRTFREDEIFDNDNLVKEIQFIISTTYNKYYNDCLSQNDIECLSRTLGVLYGSIEYWSKSDNVSTWTSINFSDNMPRSAVKKAEEKKENTDEKKESTDKKKEDNKKLSTHEFISVVGGSDAIGALVSGPAAVVASAAAALYFEVK